MSSAMVYGLLPVFLVRVLHTTIASVGIIEGIADWLGRRKPIVLLGYALSAVNKVLFPLAGDASTVLLARVIDRVGKGTRDAPRDAFLTDVTPMPIRGSGFGLRITFYTAGFVAGPLAAMALMRAGGDNFSLVFLGCRDSGGHGHCRAASRRGGPFSLYRDYGFNAVTSRVSRSPSGGQS